MRDNYKNFLSFYSFDFMLLIKDKNILIKEQLSEIVNWLKKLEPQVKCLDEYIENNIQDEEIKGTELYNFNYNLNIDTDHYINVIFGINNDNKENNHCFQISEVKYKRDYKGKMKKLTRDICVDKDGCSIHPLILFIEHFWIPLAFDHTLSDEEVKEIKFKILSILKCIFKNRRKIFEFLFSYYMSNQNHSIDICDWIVNFIQRIYKKYKFYSLDIDNNLINDDIKKFMQSNDKNPNWIMNNTSDEKELMIFNLVFYYARHYDYLFLDLLHEIYLSYILDIKKYGIKVVSQADENAIWKIEKKSIC